MGFNEAPAIRRGNQRRRSDSSTRVCRFIEAAALRRGKIRRPSVVELLRMLHGRPRLFAAEIFRVRQNRRRRLRRFNEARLFAAEIPPGVSVDCRSAAELQ